MLQKQYKICLDHQVTVLFKRFFSLVTFSIVTGFMPGISISNNNALAQSTDNDKNQAEQITADKPKQSIHRIGTTFSSGNSFSIKSTDADINSRYPQPSECWNCEFDNYIDSTTGIISHGVINGIIGSKIFRKRIRQHHIDDIGNGNHQKRHFGNELFNDGIHNDIDTNFDNSQYSRDK